MPVALPAPLDAEAVVEAVFLPALAAAYSFLIALFCCQREKGLEPASGLSFLNFSYRAFTFAVSDFSTSFRLVVGFQLVTVNGMIDGIDSGFNSLGRFLHSLNADIIILIF